VSCVNNICKGYNSVRNLLLIGSEVLTPLLRSAPAHLQAEVDAFLARIGNLKITLGEALMWVQGQIKKGLSCSRCYSGIIVTLQVCPNKVFISLQTNFEPVMLVSFGQLGRLSMNVFRLVCLHTKYLVCGTNFLNIPYAIDVNLACVICIKWRCAKHGVLSLGSRYFRVTVKPVLSNNTREAQNVAA